MRRHSLVLVALGPLAACTRISDADVESKLGLGGIDTASVDTDTDTGDTSTDDTASTVDADGDGYTPAQGDCDDGDASANPGKAEVCDDGLDNDCDGTANGCGLGPDLLAGAIRFDGEATGGGFGAAVAGGDLDDDGYSDLIVSNPTVTTNTGAVYLVRGGTGLTGRTVFPWLLGSRTTTSFGNSVAVPGDTNGDGYDDLLVGAPGASPNRDITGAGYLFLGSRNPSARGFGDGIPLAGFKLEGQAGSLVAGAGDVDGDDLADMLIRYNDSAGDAVAIVRGTARPAALRLDETPVLVVNDGTVKAAAGIGDLDGDGFGDLALADTLAEDAGGHVYIVYGQAGGPEGGPLDRARRLVGDRGWAAGYSLAGTDIDGDGRSDLVIGAPGYPGDVEKGAVFLVPGTVARTNGNGMSTGPLAAYTCWYGEEAEFGDAAGATLAAAGDVDGDGRGDVLIGSYFHSSGSYQQGIAFLVPGSAGFATQPLHDHSLALGTASEMLGWAVAGPGDVDGNGTADLLIGAPAAGTTGGVYLVAPSGL